MPRIRIVTTVNATVEQVFDLARDVEIHCRTAFFTNERIVAGRSEGLLALGDVVTFEATHLGFRQRLSARIVSIERPTRFVDEMVSGVFRSLRHVHEFRPTEFGCEMIDTVEWVSPLGLFGRIADLVVEPHLRRFITRRNANLRSIAEGKPTDGHR